MRITTNFEVDIPYKEVERIALSWLESLRKEQWVEERDGKLVLREEHYTSHRFDVDSEIQDPIRIRLVKSIQDFKEILEYIQR